MMRAAKVALVLAAVLTLTACQKRPDPAVVRAGFAAADFSQATQPLLLAEFETARTVGLLGKAGVNGTVESWQSPDGVGLSLDRGVLVRTAGTGQGLLIADASGTRAALAGQGGAEYRKLYKHLTGDNQVAETLFTCRMSGPVTEQVARVGKATQASHWQEDCSSGSNTIRNDYWTQGAGDVVKSRQWINAVAGYVITEVPVGSPR